MCKANEEMYKIGYGQFKSCAIQNSDPIFTFKLSSCKAIQKMCAKFFVRIIVFLT